MKNKNTLTRNMCFVTSVLKFEFPDDCRSVAKIPPNGAPGTGILTRQATGG